MTTLDTAATTNAATVATVDPRGPQFAAALTSVVLALVLLTAPGSVALALLATQTGLFALGAALGVSRTPHAWLFKRVVRPRLAPPEHLEDAAPPRFAQAVGLVFAAVALAALSLGLDAIGVVAVGFALAAALLNAFFGFCLGCEVYLLAKRIAS
ncbi:MAG: DUF4395 domain-containing protein [Nocardioides sp.]|jgi:hypothetical protein